MNSLSIEERKDYQDFLKSKNHEELLKEFQEIKSTVSTINSILDDIKNKKITKLSTEESELILEKYINQITYSELDFEELNKELSKITDSKTLKYILNGLFSIACISKKYSIDELREKLDKEIIKKSVLGDNSIEDLNLIHSSLSEKEKILGEEIKISKRNLN